MFYIWPLNVEPTYNLKATFSTKESMLKWLYFRESAVNKCFAIPAIYLRIIEIPKIPAKADYAFDGEISLPVGVRLWVGPRA